MLPVWRPCGMAFAVVRSQEFSVYSLQTRWTHSIESCPEVKIPQSFLSACAQHRACALLDRIARLGEQPHAPKAHEAHGDREEPLCRHSLPFQVLLAPGAVRPNRLNAHVPCDVPRCPAYSSLLRNRTVFANVRFLRVQRMVAKVLLYAEV